MVEKTEILRASAEDPNGDNTSLPVEQVRPSADHLDRLEFETLISDASASLFAAEPDQLNLVVERALGRVREFFQAERCALLSVSADQQVVNVRLASYAEGLPHVPTDVNLASVFPWSYRKLIFERAPVRVSRIADLPPEADIEREAWKQLPIRSALSLPIETGGTVGHMIVLNTVQQEREWPDIFVTRLRVLGQMLVGALEREQALAAHRASEARLASGADLAGLGFYEVDLDERRMRPPENYWKKSGRREPLQGFPRPLRRFNPESGSGNRKKAPRKACAKPTSRSGGRWIGRPQRREGCLPDRPVM